MQDSFIQAQCFAFKLTHDGRLPGEVSRKRLFRFCPRAHEALALAGAELHLSLRPCGDAAAPTASGQLRGFAYPSLAAHVAIQACAQSGNSFALCRFRGLEGKSIAHRNQISS